MRKLTLICLISCAVVSCGGSSSGPVKSTLTFPVGIALTNLNSNGFSATFSASGKLNGTTIGGSGSITQSSDSATTFEGQQALVATTTVTTTLTSSQGSVPFAVSVQGYTDTNYAPIGTVSSSEYDVVQGTSSVPTSVKVGDTGVIATFNRYSDSSKSTFLGVDHESYVVEPDTSTTAIIDTIDNEYDSTNTETLSTQSRYRIDQNGTVTWLSDTYSFLTGSPTGTLTLTSK